jgi:hypothetical protein
MSEFEPALNQVVVTMPIGLFVIETGDFYPNKPKSIELTEQTIVSDFSLDKLQRISTKIDIIMATIALALIPYKDN